VSIFDPLRTFVAPSRNGAGIETKETQGCTMGAYTVRDAKPEEQRELTRLVVSATMHAGHDEAFIDRAISGLAITLPMINGKSVQVAQDDSGKVIGVVAVTRSTLQGVALLNHLFVDPLHWRRGVGRILFETAIARAKELKTGAIFIYAEPSAEGFYEQMGTTRIGEAPFVLSPEVVFPHLLYVIPRED
jgi:N-acetylglutamate synthase-like GNAT family acetyltransferase